MDVLLITTPFFPLNYAEVKNLPLNRQERTSVTPPLGVGYIASYLKNRGYRVKIIDLDLEIFTWIKEKGGYSIIDIANLIRSVGYFDIIGISCFCSARHKQAHELARLCRGFANKVIMGGNYPTNSPMEALKDCDFVVLGEGEETFYKLLRSLEEGIGLEEIGGIAYEDKIIPRNHWIEDLHYFPLYEEPWRYHLLEMSQGLGEKRRFFTLFTSRGCPP